MSEHLRALVVILGLALPVFWIAKRLLCPALIDNADFVRRRNLWLGITLAAFLSHNYWLFLGIASLLVLWGANPGRERNPMALFFFLLFAVPAFRGSLPGLGVFQHLFEVNHVRFLALLVLLPAAVRLAMAPGTPRLGRFSADWFLLGYLALQAALYFGATTVTQTMRASFYLVVDTLLIYYVASRSVVSLRGFHDATASLGVALLVVSPIAVFEFAKHWLLYSSLSAALGLNWDAGLYLGRDSLLRAVGPAGHSLVLGYALAVGLGLWLALRRAMSPMAWWTGAAALFAGLIAPVSRGPWVGAALIVVIAVASGQRSGPRLMKFLMGGVVAVLLLAVSPYGNRLIDFLPFVGSVDEGNVTYRSQLFQASLIVISQNPWLGSATFMSTPEMEQMRQGQGIIDLVNSYLGIALSSGVVGLSLFAAFFGASLWSVYSATRVLSAASVETELLGRALFAALVGVLVMIGTVSSILAIPTLYWSLAGIAMAYASMVRGATVPLVSASSPKAAASRYFTGTAAASAPHRREGG